MLRCYFGPLRLLVVCYVSEHVFRRAGSVCLSLQGVFFPSRAVSLFLAFFFWLVIVIRSERGLALGPLAL